MDQNTNVTATPNVNLSNNIPSQTLNPTNVETNKKSDKTLIYVGVVLLIVVILTFIAFIVLYATGVIGFNSKVSDVTTSSQSNVNSSDISSVSNSSNLSSVQSSSVSSTSAVEFSTFSNDYISFQYPKGWSVVLNEGNNNNKFWINVMANDSCSNSQLGLKGVADIQLISPQNQKIEFGIMGGGVGNGGYIYKFNNPLQLEYLNEEDLSTNYKIASSIITLLNKPVLIPVSFGGEFFSADAVINGKNTKLLKYIYVDGITTNELDFGDIDFGSFSKYTPIDLPMFQKLKYDGLYGCRTFADSEEVSFSGYETLNDTPSNVANIVDTFISSIVRKK